MWCGVVWCGVVWCGVVWCGVVWYGMLWYGMVWYGDLQSTCGLSTVYLHSYSLPPQTIYSLPPVHR